MKTRTTTVVSLRLHPSGPGGKYTAYLLGLPTDIGNRLRERGITKFNINLTDEGILYTPYVERTSNPAWLGEDEKA